MERLLPHLQLIPSIHAAMGSMYKNSHRDFHQYHNVKVRATPAKRLPHVWAPIIRKRMRGGGGGGGGGVVGPQPSPKLHAAVKLRV